MSWLAQLAPAIAALACWAGVLILVWLVYFQIRPTWYLWQAAAYLMWTMFFGLVFITAGPQPVIHRVAAVLMIRNAELLGGAALLIWCVLVARSVVTLSRSQVGALLLALGLALMLGGCAPAHYHDIHTVCVWPIDPCPPDYSIAGGRI